MLRLTSSDMKRLEREGISLSSKTHRTYLAQATQSVLDSSDPLDALVLLCALWGTGYASRPHELEALNAVGKWLEQRLYHEPDVPATRIALELGWLRRMSCFLETDVEQKGDDTRDRETRPRHRDERRITLGFGKRIDAIRSRRAEAQESKQQAQIQQESPQTLHSAPDQLPQVFEAEFMDFFHQVREARQAAKDRIKRNKPPKDRFLDLQPVDPLLRPLASSLVCSLLSADGLKDVFEAIDANAGAPRSFYLYLSDIDEQDGKRIARKVSLNNPLF